MNPGTIIRIGASALALTCLGGCSDDSEAKATGNDSSGELPIVTAAGADVPYAIGKNNYGITGGAFLAKANQGSSSAVLDASAPDQICLSGTVEAVPTPADGSHPPYSEWWGIELGFNLNQSNDAAATKEPWVVPSDVTGFWFTLEGAAVPPMRFKLTPTGRDPALEQDSCANVRPESGVATQVPFAETYVQCWNGPQGTALTDISPGVLDVGIQIAAATGTEYPLNFCLKKLGVLLRK